MSACLKNYNTLSNKTAVRSYEESFGKVLSCQFC